MQKKLQVPYIRYFYYGLLGIIFVDRILLMLIPMWMDMLALTKNPDGFLQSMMYMTYHSKDIWSNGIVGTVKISQLGTVIGFILAVLLVFLRIQKITKRDAYWVALLKHLGNVFAQTYVTVIRGTPLMYKH